ncbi:MAG: hypothetical protein ACE5LQ_05645 [Candidatus Bipolaricaulia bacterium]
MEALAGGIGPRGTGTLGEAQAARYVRKRLEGLGLPAEENISADVLLRATELAWEMLRELDGGIKR